MFRIEIENEVVVVTSETGRVDHSDVVETLVSMGDNAASYRDKNLMIVDASSQYNPSLEEMQQCVSLIKSLLEHVFSRIALVVQRDFHYGLGRMIEVFSEPERGQFRVLRNEQDARAWLSS